MQFTFMFGFSPAEETEIDVTSQAHKDSDFIERDQSMVLTERVGAVGVGR